MARHKTSGGGQRKSAVKSRSRIGKFQDVMPDAKPLKGVRRGGDDFSDFAGIQIVDPAVKPHRAKVEAIRKAVRAYYK